MKVSITAVSREEAKDIIVYVIDQFLRMANEEEGLHIFVERLERDE